MLHPEKAGCHPQGESEQPEQGFRLFVLSIRWLRTGVPMTIRQPYGTFTPETEGWSVPYLRLSALMLVVSPASQPLPKTPVSESSGHSYATGGYFLGVLPVRC